MNAMPERNNRKVALAVVGGVILLFIAISAASFSPGREIYDPASISFQGFTAVDGKRIFQAYNCMGCHTLLGNGAYFAPDITGVYATNGPAWLMAWFEKPEVWPEQPAVAQWIATLIQSGDVDVTSEDAYYARFDGAQSDPAERGGWKSIMPHLSFKSGESAALVAYMDYVSRLNTEGWPPEVMANPNIIDQVQGALKLKLPGLQPTQAAP